MLEEISGSHVNDDEVNKKVKLLSQTEENSDDYEDVYCGIGSFRPTFLQPLAKITSFVGFFSVAGFLSSCLSVYISSQITTLERMFGFSSSTSGIIMAANDIGYLLSILAASYFARKTHIPRLLFGASLLYGVSGLMCCVPYFITSAKFRLSSGMVQSSVPKGNLNSLERISTDLCSSNQTAFNIVTSNLCHADEAQRQSTVSFGLTQSESTLAVVLIAVGMSLQGFAKAPRNPCVSTYIDDNAQKIKTPMYMGIIIGLSIFGPVVAFSLGGIFSRIYVTLEASEMGYRDPKWIGAWWLGFLVFGAAAVFLAMPLLFYPRHLLPKSQRLEIMTNKEKQSEKLLDPKGFAKILFRLFSNPVYCPLTIATCLYVVTVSGSVAFTAKFIETQFSVPAWKANIMMGACQALSSSTGAMTGGRIISKFKITPRRCVKIMVAIHAFLIPLNVAFLFLGCPQQDVRADRTATGVQYGSLLNDTSCRRDCFCDTSTFSPVCDEKSGLTYFSPCQAGCTMRNNTIYNDCSCVPSGLVKPGFCPSTCPMLIPFTVVLFVVSYISACTIMFGFNTILRCVTEADKPLAIGLSAFVSNLAGWMPGPILYGAIIDTTCLIWNTKCDRVGSCAMYDTPDFRYKLFGVTTGFRFLSLVFEYIAFRNLSKIKFTGIENVVKRSQNALNEALSHHTLQDKNQEVSLENVNCRDNTQTKRNEASHHEIEQSTEDDKVANVTGTMMSNTQKEDGELVKTGGEYSEHAEEIVVTSGDTDMHMFEAEDKLLRDEGRGDA